MNGWTWKLVNEFSFDDWEKAWEYYQQRGYQIAQKHEDGSYTTSVFGGFEGGPITFHVYRGKKVGS